MRSLKVSMYIACEEYIASVPEAQLIEILQKESSIVVDPGELDFNSMTSILVLTPVSMIIDFLLSPVIARDLFGNEVYDVLSNANAILLGESE